MAPLSDDEWLELIDASTALTPKSKTSYKKHVRGLVRMCGGGIDKSISRIIFNYDRSFPHLARLPPNIQRSHLCAVLCLYKRAEERRIFRRCDPHVHEEHRKWLEALSRCNNAHRRHLDDNLPSEREVESAASLREWERAHAFMQESEPGTQAALLIAFQTLALPPLRGSDLSHIRIGYQPTGNYFAVDDDGTGELVIRDHKTARYYPRLERFVPRELVRMVEKSVEAQPRNWLFSTKHGAAFSSTGYLKWKTMVFSRAFQGRPVTTNSLRHAYITEKLQGGNLSTNQQRSIAESMGHSLGMQRQYVRLPLRDRF